MQIVKQITRKQLHNYERSFRLVNNNSRFKKIFNYLKESRFKGRLLDIGCGTGDFGVLLKTLGFRVHGLELNREAVKKAQKKRIIVKEGSFLEGLPYKNAQFEVVFAGETIEHTVDDDFFLKECFRVLKPGGLLILTTPNLVSLGNRFLMFLGFMPRFAYQEYHYRIYNLPLLKNKLDRAGFDIKTISAGHILISQVFNRPLGFLGEHLATLFPSLGEQFIIYATKSLKKPARP